MPPYAYDYGSETDSTSYILLVRSRLMASIVGGLSVFLFNLLYLVALVGLEPTPPYGEQDLNLSRLPIPPQGRIVSL